MAVLLRAAMVLPVARPPITDGAVLIAGNRIRAVGRWRDLSPLSRRPPLDLGEVIVMPGLVNAHCHLDYTNMAGHLQPPRLFTDWLKQITSIKAGWGRSEFAESWKEGAGMLLRSGTTSVADIEAVPELLPEVWQSTPLRMFTFMEMIGLTQRRRPEAILQAAVELINAVGRSCFRAGLSPHAPYSASPELLGLCARTARQRRWRLCTHVAESALEFEMFARGGGEMFDWLRRSTRDMSDCGLGSPVQHLERCGVLGENLLAIHANYLGKQDATLLGRRHVHVVHCPRSHGYFRHDAFPYRRLSAARVNVCLGTDSLASVSKSRRQHVQLNMFEEMRALAHSQPALSARKILRMATLSGARALGMAGRIGELSQNAFADLIALPYSGKLAGVYDGVLHHEGEVAASMINGQWAMAPPQVAGNK